MRQALALPVVSRRVRGVTLIELLLVVALMALAAAGVTFALNDPAEAQLAREGQRLAALLDAARSVSRASGQTVTWRVTPEGFSFDGLPARGTPAPLGQWLESGVTVQAVQPVVLGPEPVTGPQSIVLGLQGKPGRLLLVATDGLRPYTTAPFAVAAPAP